MSDALPIGYPPCFEVEGRDLFCSTRKRAESLACGRERARCGGEPERVSAHTPLKGQAMKAIAASLSLVFASGAQAQSLVDKYELSERCGKRAAEVFAKATEETAGLTIAADNYENHYNSRFNKCFYLESHQRGAMRSLMLIDLNDHKEIGAYIGQLDSQDPVKCVLQEKRCKTQEEWRALIKPFMED